MSCEELERAMDWAKEDYEANNDVYDPGFGNLNNPLGLANEFYNWVYSATTEDERLNRAKHHAIYSACQYWQVKQEYSKRC